jgi:hypothetical protein
MYGLLGLTLLFSLSCASAQPKPTEARSDAPAVGTQGYALLADLMGDEKSVSKLLIIKRERAELRTLVKEISECAGRAHKELEALGKADRALNIKETGLPAAEVKTRQSIAKARGKELLTDSGKDFELRLLLTQNEALTYGSHLAGVMAKDERDTKRAKFLHDLSSELASLHQKVVAMLLANYSLPAEK